MEDRKVIVKLDKFSKKYKDKSIIKQINLEVYEGEFLTLLGSSGCGKTTILRSISGLDEVTKGRIFIDGVDVTYLPPQKREVNTIFQNYALFPLMSVRDNIAFGLKMKKVSESEIDKRVKAMLKLVKLEGYEDRLPKELSGGEQQRVSIARGLINNPKVLLLDEPISALDLKLRKKMHYELKELQRSLGITFIYVTHDQDEALSMSDRIVLLKNGRIEQIGCPVDIYEKPESLYVADFLGEANVFKGLYKNKLVNVSDDINFKVLNKLRNKDKVNVIIRPENVKLTKEKNNEYLKGTITGMVYDGSFTKIIIDSFGYSIKALVFGNDKLYNTGDVVYMYWDIEDLIVLGD